MRHQSHVDVAFRSYQDFPISLYLNGLLFPKQETATSPI